MMLPSADRVLLRNEWSPTCPECDKAPSAHDLGCEWDQALSERGFATQGDRDNARKALNASAPTIPPPPSR